MSGTQPSGPTPSAEASATVARADECDAAGNHVEAVNVLAAGARRGDLQAMTRLGKRLLVGDRAPHLPSDGARLLEDAARIGDAEAAAVIAVLYAVGLSRRHGLDDALDELALAAERGWRPAQAQLRLLAHDALAVDAPVHEDWRRLRGAIDLGVWRASPSGDDLCAAPLVRRIPEFLGAGVRRWLIDKSRTRLTRAEVYEALSKRTTVSDRRTNTAATFNLLDTDLVCVLAQVRMAACAGIEFRHLEPLTVLHYDTGEEITENYDFVDPNVPDHERELAARGQRVMTFLVYLNDDYAGGNTEFPELRISHRGRSGEALFFVNALPDGGADIRTLHADRAPTQGEKWIVSQFMRDRPAF